MTRSFAVRRLYAGAVASALLLSAAAVHAQPADALVDPSFKGKEVVAFIGVKKGDRVADIVAGRFVRILSQAVGPTGKVYAIETAEIAKAHPEGAKMLTALARLPDYANVVVTTDPAATPLPKDLDAVFIRQNYHDLYDKFMGPVDVAAFNKAVYAALKPGGVYVVLDHADAKGTGIKDTETLHRIDEDRVKADVLAAGFKLDAESNLLANPADDHTKTVFDNEIRGKTDQFLLRFRKPR